MFYASMFHETKANTHTQHVMSQNQNPPTTAHKHTQAPSATLNDQGRSQRIQFRVRGTASWLLVGLILRAVNNVQEALTF